MEIKEIRAIRKRRPIFIRQDFTFRNRVAYPVWRKPRGKHSKMRLKEGGKRARVKVGYGSPKTIKYLHVSGLPMVRVENASQLNNVSKSQLVILSRTLGNKKRLMLLKAAKEKGIKFANISDVDKVISVIENDFKARKEKKSEKLKSKTEKKPAEKKEAKKGEGKK